MVDAVSRIIGQSPLASQLWLAPQKSPQLICHSLSSQLASEITIYLQELPLHDSPPPNPQKWAKAVTEIQWDDDQHLDCTHRLYRPPSFTPNHRWNLDNLLAQVDRLRGQVLVEITSQVVLNQSNRLWNQALHQAIDRLQKLDSDQRTPYAETLSLYQNLVRNRPAKLYELSVRAFSEHPADALHLLTAWTDTALSGDRPAIKLYEAHDPRFAEHLRTFADRQPMPPQPWSEPQCEIGQLTFDEAIRPPKKGLLDRYSDGSLSGPQPKLSDKFKQILPSQPHALPGSHPNATPSLPNSSPNQDSGSSLANCPPSALAKSSGVSGSLLSTFRNSNTPPAATVADLRPLSNHLPIEIAERFITPCIELVNHYRNLQQAEANQPFSQTYTLESLIQSYSHLINDDQYIVGTDANGQPVISDFKELPHRFIAGETGAGKTNFLKFLLYQLLWHNPNRSIWIADFKGGIAFKAVSEIFPNVKLITDDAAFAQLLQDFWKQVEDRATEQAQSSQKGSEYLSQLSQEEFDQELAYFSQLSPEEQEQYETAQNPANSWNRNLLIIDETAQLAHLYDDRNQREATRSVKANIDKIVRLGRDFKANVVFCTQSREESILDSNLLNNVGDRLVFRVSADTVSMRFLGSELASKISPKTKGRGIYRGPNYAGDSKDLQEVATPRFPDDKQIIEINLWRKLKHRQR